MSESNPHLLRLREQAYRVHAAPPRDAPSIIPDYPGRSTGMWLFEWIGVGIGCVVLVVKAAVDAAGRGAK